MWFAEGLRMVDASFVTAPRQRNTREENSKIKEGDGKDLWNDNPNKKRHKDVDARWTKKGDEKFYGYKNSTKADTRSKLIKKYKVTDASKHDSQMLDDLLDNADKRQPLYGDSAYTGTEQKKVIKRHKMKNMVHNKGVRNKPLSVRLSALNQTGAIS
jgi:transposase, IS5 family